MNDRILQATADLISRSKTAERIGSALWRTLERNGIREGHSKIPLKVLILNAPCNGFGDLIFALKLSGYIKRWYGAEVTIATTYADGLIKLTGTSDGVVALTGGKTQCRRFRHMKFGKTLHKQDLIMVAPVTIDFDASLKDVQYIVPYANYANTISFSEYNDKLSKKFTFHTGVGGQRSGILLTDVKIPRTRPGGLRNPYGLVYVNRASKGVEKCVASFIGMICQKNYKNTPRLDVVLPAWYHEVVIPKDMDVALRRYHHVDIVMPNGDRRSLAGEGKTFSGSRLLTLRCDVLPIPNKEMSNLIAKSLPDVLLTGDQSITDAFSCCSDKNIYYQIVPWKANLAPKLAKHMPNKYLTSSRTSCGGLGSVRYKSNYKKFVDKWDFRVLARPRMDAIVASIRTYKKSADVRELVDAATSTLRVRHAKSRVRAVFGNRLQS